MEPAELQALHTSLGALPVSHGEEPEDVSLTAIYLCSASSERANQLLSHVDPLHKAKLSNDMTRLQCRYSRDTSASSCHGFFSNTTSPTKPTPLTALNVRNQDILNLQSDRPSLSDYLEPNHPAQDTGSTVSHQTSVRKVVEWNDNPNVHTPPDLTTGNSLSMEERAAKLAALSVLNAQAQALLQQLGSMKATMTGFADTANTNPISMAAWKCTVSPIMVSQLNTQLTQLKRQLEAVSGNQLPQKAVCLDSGATKQQPQPGCKDSPAQQQLKLLQALAMAVLTEQNKVASETMLQGLNVPAVRPGNTSATSPLSGALHIAMQQLAELKAKAVARQCSPKHPSLSAATTTPLAGVGGTTPSHLAVSQVWTGSVNPPQTSTPNNHQQRTSTAPALNVLDSGVGIAELRAQALQLLAKAATTRATAGVDPCTPVTGSAEQSTVFQSSNEMSAVTHMSPLFVTGMQQPLPSQQTRPWTIADI